MKTSDYLKNPILYYIALLFCFFIIFSNSFKEILIFNITPLYSFPVPDYILNLIDIVLTFTPYAFLFVLAIFMLARYSYSIKRIKFLSVVKFVIFLVCLLTILVILLSFMPAAPNVQRPNVAAGGNTTTTTTSPHSQSTAPLPNLQSNNEYFNLIFVFIAGIVVLIVIFTSRNVIKHEDNGTDKPKKKEEFKRIFDPVKNEIIEKYLRVSKYLEDRGINPDYSLTPIEFDTETKVKLKLKEFENITYYYELARFSENPFTEEDYKTFQDNLDILYEKVEMLNIEKIVKNR